MVCKWLTNRQCRQDSWQQHHGQNPKIQVRAVTTENDKSTHGVVVVVSVGVPVVHLCPLSIPRCCWFVFLTLLQHFSEARTQAKAQIVRTHYPTLSIDPYTVSVSSRIAVKKCHPRLWISKVDACLNRRHCTGFYIPHTLSLTLALSFFYSNSFSIRHFCCCPGFYCTNSSVYSVDVLMCG